MRRRTPPTAVVVGTLPVVAGVGGVERRQRPHAGHGALTTGGIEDQRLESYPIRLPQQINRGARASRSEPAGGESTRER